MFHVKQSNERLISSSQRDTPNHSPPPSLDGIKSSSRPIPAARSNFVDIDHLHDVAYYLSPNISPKPPRTDPSPLPPPDACNTRLARRENGVTYCDACWEAPLFEFSIYPGSGEGSLSQRDTLTSMQMAMAPRVALMLAVGPYTSNPIATPMVSVSVRV